MSMRDPKPEIMRLEELALLVKSGEIKLPKFQRPFVWHPADMLKLLDSIYKGYPIGSILIWHSSQRLTSERSIAGLEVDEKQQGWFPTNYLLDGQQRLTTLCGALFWKGGDEGSIWNIHFDLDKEEFVYPKDPDLVSLFPLNRLINTSDFIRQCMKFEHHPNRVRYVQVAEALLRVIKDYKVAVVKIGDMTVEQVAPIFERINSTGRKLTIVDLMMAATWSDGFDLTVEINRIKEACAAEGLEGISDQLVLRSISAAADLGINKDDIQRLRTQSAEKLLQATSSASIALSQAIRFLRESTALYDFSYLPYGLQLTHIAEFFRACKEPTQSQLDELHRWFWFTAITRYFSGANTGQNTSDLAKIRSFAIAKSETLFDRRELDISQLLFDKFNLRNATSTTFALLLINSRPTRSIDGRAIDEAYLKVKSSQLFGGLIKGAVGKQNIAKTIFPFPDDLVPEHIDCSELTEHLLDERCYEAIRVGDEGLFVNSRAEYFQRIVEKLTSCPVAFQAAPRNGMADEASDYSMEEFS